MFRVVEYRTHWRKHPGLAEMVGRAKVIEILREFDSLEDARLFVHDREYVVIEFPKQVIEEFNG